MIETQQKYVSIARDFLRDMDMPTVHHRGQVLTYNNRHYTEISTDKLGLLVRKWAIQNHAELKRAAVAEVVETIRADTMTDHDAALPFWDGIDGPPTAHIIPFRNGLLDIETMELQEHTPRFVCTYSLPYDYTPDAKCREWEGRLAEVYEGDQARINLLQEWFGYCLTPDISQHKFLGLCGVQRSLKSTILHVLHALVGGANATAYRLGQLATQFGLEGLLGKQLAIVSEVELDGASQKGDIVERLKAITGGDSQEIPRKFQTPVSTVLPTRFVFAANKMPLLFDGSSALADRLMLIEHKRSFLGKEDRDLKNRLLAEIEGIAVWALAGYRRVRQNGKFSAVDCDLMTRFRRASASIDSFLRERCVVHESIGPLHLDLKTTPDKIEVAKPDLFGHYVSYCERYNVYPRAEKSFHADLTELIPALPDLSYRPHGQPWRYRGIKVREGFNE